MPQPKTHDGRYLALPSGDTAHELRALGGRIIPITRTLPDRPGFWHAVAIYNPAGTGLVGGGPWSAALLLQGRRGQAELNRIWRSVDSGDARTMELWEVPL